MAELVDAPGLGPGAERRESSSLLGGTKVFYGEWDCLGWSPRLHRGNSDRFESDILHQNIVSWMRGLNRHPTKYLINKITWRKK